MIDSLVRSPEAATKKHALESERSGEEAQGIYEAVVVAGVDDDRTVCPARHLAPGGVQHIGALRAGRLGRFRGAQSCASLSSQSNATGNRTADRGPAAPAHALGTAQAEGGAGTTAAGGVLAGRQHHGRTGAPRRSGDCAPEAATDGPVYDSLPLAQPTQPRLLRRLH